MRRGAKIAIIVLSVLLVVSVSALAVVLIYYRNHYSSGEGSLRGNVISGTGNAQAAVAGRPGAEVLFDALGAPVRPLGGRAILYDDVVDKNDVDLKLHSENPEENQPFYVDNMFPGDSVTKYYRLDVSYNQKVEVLFRAPVREGYEFLAQRLNIRVYLETTGQELYNGSVAGLTDDVVTELTHANPGTDQLLYRITVSIDTAAGNEYQNTETWLRFDWTVKDKSDLIPPQTGLTPVSIYIIVSVLSVAAVLLLIVVWKRRRRREESEA